jgi:hypothetical protein
LLELVWQALTFGAAMYIGALVAVVLLLLLPVLDRLREPNGWWAPLVGLVLTLGFTGVGLALATPSATRPLPSTLLYALDRQAGEAMWITDASNGSQHERGREWAEVRTGATFQASDAAQVFGYGRPAAVAPAPVADVPALEMSVVADTVVAGSRRMEVAVRSGAGAERMIFDFGDGPSAPRLRAVNGQEMDRLTPRLDYWGQPEGALLLDLDLPMEEQLSFEVVEHHFRPEDLPGVGTVPFMREPHLAPNVRTWSDRALLRTVVGGGASAQADSLDAAMADPVVVGGAATDSAGAAMDTTGGADTTRSAMDTTVAVDTTGLPMDTAGAAADTLAPADTLPPPDTGSAPPDTISPGTGAAPPDSGTIPNGRGTGAAPPDNGTVSDGPGTLGVAPRATVPVRPATGNRLEERQ